MHFLNSGITRLHKKNKFLSILFSSTNINFSYRLLKMNLRIKYLPFLIAQLTINISWTMLYFECQTETSNLGWTLNIHAFYVNMNAEKGVFLVISCHFPLTLSHFFLRISHITHFATSYMMDENCQNMQYLLIFM